VPTLKGWAVLTVILEQPSYAREIGDRYVERFGDLLGQRRQLHDGVLPNLRAEGFIAVYYGRGPGKAHYRATSPGAARWREWLYGPFASHDGVDDDSWVELADDLALEAAVRILAAPDGDSAGLLSIANRYEEAILSRKTQSRVDLRARLLSSIVRDEQQAMIDADLRWIQDCRDRLGV
jgi:DNA-binding PadR family transcriptional regulator